MGAAMGAFLLHEAMREAGHDSYILTNSSYPVESRYVLQNRPTWLALSVDIISRAITKIIAVLLKPNKNYSFGFGLAGTLYKWPRFFLDYDIVHFHWVNSFSSLGQFFILSLIRKPCVVTIRDMWYFTGGCSYSLDCNGYVDRCSPCPAFINNSIFTPASVLQYIKRFIFKMGRFSFVAISQAIKSQAESSWIFQEMPVSLVYNAIDEKSFFPAPVDMARSRLGLDKCARYVLFGCTDLYDYYKGFDRFAEAINSLDIPDIHILLFGKSTAYLLR